MNKLGAALCAVVLLTGSAGGARAQQAPSADQAQPHTMPKMLDEAVFAHLLFDQLEGRFGFNQGNTFRWQAEAWLGTDENRMWLLSEGRYSNNQLDDGIQQLFARFHTAFGTGETSEHIEFHRRQHQRLILQNSEA